MLWAAAEAKRLRHRPLGDLSRLGLARGQVRKGERSTTVVFWKSFRKDGESQSDSNGIDGGDEPGRPRFMGARVFGVHQSQVDGYEAPCPTPLDEVTRHAGADAFFAT